MTDQTKMIALKPMRYATRHLVADDAFEASARDARTLNAIRKARYLTPEELAALEKREERDQKKEDLKASAAEVLAQVDTVPFLRFKNLAAEVLGEATPATKVEIIAALEKRAGVSS